MNYSEYINVAELKKTLAILKPDGQLFECRILKEVNGKKTTISGYFKNTDTLLSACEKVDLRNTNVYITLNFVNEACYSRTQRDRFISSATTTSDNDIIGYQWFFIDLDPIRATGVSSSDDELKASAEMAGKVYRYLQSLGFEEPVKAKSGNGYHLLYRINLANNSDNEELVHRCLEVLSDMFSNNDVKIDTVNSNPSRICKLHGTLAQKGANSEERPHRFSKVYTDCLDIKINDKSYLEKLASQLQREQKPQKVTSYQHSEFNLEDFLWKNGITYHEMQGSGRDNSVIYALDVCPFDNTHINGDAKIFKYGDGAISFKCHHNSCRKYRWQDLREKFEPDAYTKTDFDSKYEFGWQQHNRNKTAEKLYEVKTDENPLGAFRTAKEIAEEPEPEHEYIKCGISEIDRQIHGLQKQSISVISGLRASGKSTLLGNIILKAVDEGHTTVVYSGELANKKYLNWLIRQAAGKNHIQVSLAYQNGVGVSDEVKNRIYDWMGDKFWLYDNKYGNDFKKISETLSRILIEKRADLCIIDNLMALDLSGLDKNDKYEAQTKFVWRLKEIAEQTNTHIIFVAHPKKVSGLIRLEDISGTGNISNIIDNAFMVHRNNHDFQKKYREEYNHEYTQDIDEHATNIIEIAKDRENGLMDYFIPLYFESNTKRLKNSIDEFIQYGWEGDLEECIDEQYKQVEELPF